MTRSALITVLLCGLPAAGCITEDGLYTQDTADGVATQLDADEDIGVMTPVDTYDIPFEHWFCIAVHRDCDHPLTVEPGGFEPRCNSDYFLGSGEHRWQARHQALSYCNHAHPDGCDLLKCERDTF